MPGEVVVRVEHLATHWTRNLFDWPLRVLVDDVFQAAFQIHNRNPQRPVRLCGDSLAARSHFKTGSDVIRQRRRVVGRATTEIQSAGSSVSGCRRRCHSPLIAPVTCSGRIQTLVGRRSAVWRLNGKSAIGVRRVPELARQHRR